MEISKEKEFRYLQAKKRVKEVKGFYIHALVYILVNLAIVLLKYYKNGTIHFQEWGLGFWGIGLLIHGFSVFIPNFFLGKNWEERKIRELMEKERNGN